MDALVTFNCKLLASVHAHVKTGVYSPQHSMTWNTLVVEVSRALHRYGHRFKNYIPTSPEGWGKNSDLALVIFTKCKLLCV